MNLAKLCGSNLLIKIIIKVYTQNFRKTDIVEVVDTNRCRSSGRHANGILSQTVCNVLCDWGVFQEVE